MKNKILIALSIMISGTANFTNAQASGLAGSEWGTEKPLEQFIKFGDDGKLNGFGGCNNMFGSYHEKKSATHTTGLLKIGPLASTKKACSQDVMKAEFDFITKLERVTSYQRSSHHLELKDKSSKVILRLRWRDFD